ncbi:hypothetical protein HY357_04080 [Candidatus Roizmanbacteria bacterium]|nr:hypothetical protein [Candidatus Roizmanbacteria bacterium]
MFDSPFSKRSLVYASLFSLLILAFIFLGSYFSDQTKLVFCDVGQGDGAYIRLKNQFDIVIDAGSDRKMLHCLGKYMPFYDKTIELAIISHPQKDHYGGFIHILEYYRINQFWMSKIFNNNRSFNALIKTVRLKEIPIQFPSSLVKKSIADGVIQFYWPTNLYFAKNAVSDPNIDPEFLLSGLDLNNFSLIFRLKTNRFSTLFTGDAPPEVLDGLPDQTDIKSKIIKVPHHGSKNGLTVEFLKLAGPTYGVISVGNKNSYGHPSAEVLEMLEASGVKIRRTDLEGDIVYKLPN